MPTGADMTARAMLHDSRNHLGRVFLGKYALPALNAFLRADEFELASLAADAATYLDTGFHLYVYIGADARAESARAITATAAYEKKHRRPALPVSVVKHGQHDAGFEGHFYDPPPDESCCVVM